MSRKHPWAFKNRREQHKYIVDLKQRFKHDLRHIHHGPVHTKERWRKADYLHDRE